ncbi:MAG: hypothetical protein QOF76_3510 [Solirubrobacteraceae bacterium]|jgi:hypothetical protein|nr:hypothetical protein [Solirubrobacteraceae bacterium]
MAAGGPGVVHIPWYATFFRAERFAEALEEIAPLALRYGATDYHVYQSRDDKYKFLHTIAMPDKLSWERYWNGNEFINWREEHTSWYQVPVLYVWHNVIASGRHEVNGNGGHDPVPEPDPEPAEAA